MILKLFIGNDKLDLFPDENITVNSSIADTQDITKNTTDFTKTFTVPASDINNRTFKHYYDARIDNAFDARIKVSGRIELDGIPFRTGKWRLSKVSVKSGHPSAYTINFWGNLVDLETKLRKDKLIDLDLTAFDHDYNSVNSKIALTSSLFSGAIIYNLLVKKQYFYNSDPTENTQTDTLANIAFGGGSNTGVVWNDVRASIQVIKIIEAIETDFNITFSRDFFGRAEFTSIYMWLNSSATTNIGGSIQLIDWDGGDTTNVNLTTDTGSFLAKNTSKKDDRQFWKHELRVTPEAGNELIEYKIKLFVDGTLTKETTHTGTKTQKFKLEFNGGEKTFTLKYEIETDQEFDYTARWRQKKIDTFLGFETIVTFDTTASADTVLSVFTIADNMPDITLVDFLKALFNMFKLVVIPLDNGTVFVNTLNDFYDQGKLIDITRHIDFENIEVARGDILNEINFNFEEPSTILNIQFEKNNNIAYGDNEALLTDENGEPLDGDSLDFQIPFEQVVYERLLDLIDNSETNVQYGAIIDDKLDPANPESHLFYNINTEIGTKKIGFIDEVGVKSDLGSFINTASHTNTYENQQFALLFDSEFSTWNGELINNTLFSNYHEEYISNIFNIKRRNFNFLAELPLDILISMKLNDVLKIKEEFYRIDNFNQNLITGKTTLNLINAFDVVIGAFTPSRTDIFVDFNAQQESIFVTFLDDFSFVKQDTGHGTAFITVTSSGSNVFFDFTKNETGFERDMFIDFTDNPTGKTFTVYLNQEQKVVTVDSTIITVDSTLITADNG